MTTYFWNEEELVTKFLNELLDVIDHLPYPGNIRTLLKYNVITDFCESLQFDDANSNIGFPEYITNESIAHSTDLKFTIGIQNFSQANRYVYEFIQLLHHVRVEALEDIFFPKEMFFVDETKIKAGPTMHDVGKHTILRGSKVDIYSIEDFTNRMITLLGDSFREIISQNKMAEENDFHPPHNYNKIILEYITSKIYLVEELEYMFCIAAVDYFYFRLRHPISKSYHPKYMRKMLQGPIKEIFINRMHAILAPLTKEMQLFYLECSYNQFTSYAPDLRQQDLYDKFWATFNFPKPPPTAVKDGYIKFIDEIFEEYHFDFWDYSQIVQDALVQFSFENPETSKLFIQMNQALINMYITGPAAGILPMIPSEIIATQIHGNTGTIISYTYKFNNKNFEAVADLYDNLVKHKFIFSNTNKKDFRKIFENQSPQNPIIWTGNISELYFFVKLLHIEYKLIESLGKKIWNVTDQIFLNAQGKPFGKQRFRSLKKPASYKYIKQAVDLLQYNKER